MSDYVTSIKVNIFDGKFNQTVNLLPGLNIIAGANGSGKTEFLKFLQQNISNRSVVGLSNPTSTLRVSTFMPKRNAEKVAMEEAYRRVRQDVNVEQNTLSIMRQQIQDLNFQTIKPITEYLAISAQKIVYQNNKPSDSAHIVVKKYQDVLGRVFDYELNFAWDIKDERYISTIAKEGMTLNFEQLSSGENALISLIFAIFYAKDETDVYLVDEPEIHLNWQLEERLFSFLAWLAENHGKQIIVVTHSRVCFIEPFLQLSQFFSWKDKQIHVKSKIDETLTAALAGDVVKIVTGITAQNKIIYVEDPKQSLVLKVMGELLNKNIEIVILGNSEKIKTHAKAFKKIGISNVHFLLDGDNKPVGTDGSMEYHDGLVQLEKYCIENYFLNFDILAAIDQSNPKKEIAHELFSCIREVTAQNFVPIKTLLTTKELLTSDVLDRLDASAFIKQLSARLGFDGEKDMIVEYLKEVHRQGRLAEIFPQIMTKFAL